MMQMIKWLLAIGLASMALTACTQETQNRIGRSIQNWTGTNGVLEIYAGDKLVRKFINIDKISTAYGTDDGQEALERYRVDYDSSRVCLVVYLKAHLHVVWDICPLSSFNSHEH